jgi:hypothetical protein
MTTITMSESDPGELETDMSLPEIVLRYLNDDGRISDRRSELEDIERNYFDFCDNCGDPSPCPNCAE